MCLPNLFTFVKDHIGPCRAILPQRPDWNLILQPCCLYTLHWRMKMLLASQPHLSPKGRPECFGGEGGSALIHIILTSGEQQEDRPTLVISSDSTPRQAAGWWRAGLATGPPHLGLILHQQDTSPGQGTQPAGTSPVKTR